MIELTENKDLAKDAEKISIEWQFLRYFRTTGYLVEIDSKRKEAVIFLPDKELMVIADVSSYINIEKLKANRIYDMVFAIYHARAGERLRQLIIDKLKEPYHEIKSKYTKDYYLYKVNYFEQFFSKVDTFYRFELLKASDWYYSDLIKKRFEDHVRRSYKTPTVFKWRHLLGY
ncbi:MAG: hypothetical protein RMI49_04880 [Candidatus Caldarchaeum sp.]|nr:hypothetical protein [Candidatus Caldarchaeum sp.]